MLEQYVKTINVEAQLMVLMANRYILPAALAYQTASRAERRRRARRPASSRARRRSCSSTSPRRSTPSKQHRQAGVGGRSLGRLVREARQVHARQRHPGDERAARARRQARDGRAVDAHGRCRPTAKCCSSSSGTSNAGRQQEPAVAGSCCVRRDAAGANSQLPIPTGPIASRQELGVGRWEFLGSWRLGIGSWPLGRGHLLH